MESFYLLEELSLDKLESTLLLDRAQAYLSNLHLGLFPQKPEAHSPKFSCYLRQQNGTRGHLVMPKLQLLLGG